ncbi:cyanophycinase [Thalassotalea sp. PS06]|uniref:cyanophycinase n=1 Tax=Thalassotalea sp. PS06 TaxID=2594005 RepID=UPI001163BF92|nr:cyanophycinase [Thalassotalea sp. PS06]QDP00932.1 cyanophycinase [Thalassotalea sp. PS06]
MKMLKAAVSVIFLGAYSLTAVASESNQGQLVIAGGAISHKSIEIFETFAQLSGGEKAKIGVIPAASGSIGKQYKLLQQQFSAAGVSLNNIQLLPLATKDDKNTDVDEGSWIDNGNSEKVAASINGLSGIWFIGGDQTLITKVLLNNDGSDTKVLQQIRKVFESGTTIGGTSAGAAIMSNIMIAGGNSQGALFSGFKHEYTSMDEQEYGPAATTKGLGFFKDGIIDQHFDRKGRLGRLLVTLLNEPEYGLGFGVDEGTAMIVDGSSINVIGEGGVTIVDVENVTGYQTGTFPVKANNIRLSFLQPGDSYDLTSGKLTKRQGAYETVSKEYFNVPEQSISGLVNANRNLYQFIGYDLLDNKATNQVSSWLIDGDKAIKMTFSQDEKSQGYWNTDVTADVYSFENVKMDIQPLKIRISE